VIEEFQCHRGYLGNKMAVKALSWA